MNSIPDPDQPTTATAGNPSASAAPPLSPSAIGAAVARAAHLIVDDEPAIFADTLAARLLGPLAEPGLGYHRTFGTAPVLAGARAEAVCRARLAEDTAVASGASQLVVLGAGLDTTAYRLCGGDAPAGRALRTVVEVDTPEAQTAKRALLAAAGIAEPASVHYVPADLETADLGACLHATGLDLTVPTVVTWLGVTMYLTIDAILATASAIARLAPGSLLVADYVLAPPLRDEAGAAYAEALGAAVAGGGEPWLSTFDPGELTALLTSAGFTAVRHSRQRAAIPAHLWDRTDALRPMDVSGLVVATV